MIIRFKHALLAIAALALGACAQQGSFKYTPNSNPVGVYVPPGSANRNNSVPRYYDIAEFESQNVGPVKMTLDRMDGTYHLFMSKTQRQTILDKSTTDVRYVGTYKTNSDVVAVFQTAEAKCPLKYLAVTITRENATGEEFGDCRSQISFEQSPGGVSGTIQDGSADPMVWYYSDRTKYKKKRSELEKIAAKPGGSAIVPSSRTSTGPDAPAPRKRLKEAGSEVVPNAVQVNDHKSETLIIDFTKPAPQNQ